MNDENHENHELPDPRLEELFASEHSHLPAEPFLTATLRAVAAQRRRAEWTARALQAAGLIALIALSPRLIAAAGWVAMRFDAWAVESPAAPFVLASAVLCALAAVATKWARIW